MNNSIGTLALLATITAIAPVINGCDNHDKRIIEELRQEISLLVKERERLSEKIGSCEGELTATQRILGLTMSQIERLLTTPCANDNRANEERREKDEQRQLESVLPGTPERDPKEEARAKADAQKNAEKARAKAAKEAKETGATVQDGSSEPTPDTQRVIVMPPGRL